MEGKNLSEFIDSLYFNPEIEIEYSNKKFLISGYRDDDNSYLSPERDQRWLICN